MKHGRDFSRVPTQTLALDTMTLALDTMKRASDVAGVNRSLYLWLAVTIVTLWIAWLAVLLMPLDIDPKVGFVATVLFGTVPFSLWVRAAVRCRLYTVEMKARTRELRRRKGE